MNKRAEFQPLASSTNRDQRIEPHAGYLTDYIDDNDVDCDVDNDDHNATRLGNNHREKCKNHKLWRLNYVLLNNQQITEEIKEEMKNTQRQMTMKTH